MNIDFFNESDYEINSIKYWPRISSTSHSKNVAIQWSSKDSLSEVLIFEIHLLPRKNQVPTNINLKDITWSFYPQEREVTLLPFFGFQVLDIYTEQNTNVLDETFNTKVVKLIELPHQDILKIEKKYQSQVIWFDQ